MEAITTVVQFKDFSVTVGYPTAGQKMEIESLKIGLSGGAYRKLIEANHLTANEMLNLIDAVAYFRVLAPEVDKNLGIEEFNKIDEFTAAQLVRGYEQFVIFMTGIKKNIMEMLGTYGSGK